jgi:hypothetical protein
VIVPDKEYVGSVVVVGAALVAVLAVTDDPAVTV